MSIETTSKTSFEPNEKQKMAINQIEGQVMVLAGPGTGKTFTVIQRIKSMLQKGIKADSILCLTFSEAAANEMRARLIKEMGVIASSVDVFTYHSFCNDLIKQNPMKFEMASNVRIITDTLKIELMKESVDEAQLKYFVAPRADKYHFVGKFIKYIENLKAKRIEKETYFELIRTNPLFMPKIEEIQAEITEREANGKTQNKGRYTSLEKAKINVEKTKELWTLYEIYSRKMQENNLIDFSDMINLVLNAFETDKEFLKEVSSKYNYFLVDEYQDTNGLQNGIIFNLLDGTDKKNIFVVGDDDQIIYGFQGAKSDNVENFLTKYPQTTVICLNENNRSTQEILDLSYLVVSQDKSRLENNDLFKNYNIFKKLTAKNQSIIKKSKKIRRWQFGDTIQEFNHIVEDIEKLILSGNCPTDKDGQKDLSQISIICKKRDALATFSEMLKAKNIQSQIDEGKSIFTIRSSILIYFYMKALNNHVLNSDKLFGLLLAEPFNINLEDYNKLLKANKINKKDFISNIEELKDCENWTDKAKIYKLLQTFKDLKEYSETNSLRNIILEIVNRTGILEFFFKTEKNKTENILGIKKIIDEATELANQEKTIGLNEFIEHLDSALKNEIDICIDKSSLIQNAIQLVTYHGSKGREFEHVYLPALTSKDWEDFKMPGEYKLVTDEYIDPQIADEKRDSELLKLLFVGITRAKYALTLSFADTNAGKAQQITKYLTIANDFDFEKAQFEFNENDFAKEFIKSITTEPLNNRKAFEAEIKERVKTIVLSPSRLNDYKDCPRKFFYLKVLGISVEDSDWDAANYGSAIHSILEKGIRVAQRTNKYPPLAELIENFNNYINSAIFSTDAKKEMYKKRGEKSLTNYYPHFVETSPDTIFDVEYTFSDIQIGDKTVAGKIDRIEKNNDGTFSLYDYKTGTPVPEKKVSIGEDKENYYNQLCFYKYAFEKYTGENVSQVGLIYVENPEKNVYKRLTNEDSEYIENEIKKAYTSIESLEFNPLEPRNLNYCKYCAYSQICKLDVL